MSRKDPETVEPWRSALREGDPALGAPDLDPQEVARLRRAVLAAAAEKLETPRPERPRLLPWLSPAWGGALAAAAAVLLLALALWWSPEPQPEQMAVREPAPAPQAPPSPPLVSVPAAPAAPEPEKEVPGTSVPDRPAVPPPAPVLPPDPVPAPPAPEPEVALAEEVEEVEAFELDWTAIPEQPATAAEDLPRQVQFATPGGTRVIWVLGPDDDSTQEANSMGPEEKTE